MSALNLNAKSERKMKSADLAKIKRGYVVFDAHDDSVTDVALAPDGNVMCTSSNDGLVKFWNTSALVAQGTVISKVDFIKDLSLNIIVANSQIDRFLVPRFQFVHPQSDNQKCRKCSR